MACTRVALVTGSNKGIGFAIVRNLCRIFDGDVILCSRDEVRGQSAVVLLQAEGLKPKLCRLAIDDPRSVIAARDFLLKEYGGLDVLVNNAAIAYLDESVKPVIEIARETVGINYSATSSVCDILFPILRPGARVVNISSSAGLLKRIPSQEIRIRLSSPTLTRRDIDQLADEYFKDIENGVAAQKGWPSQKFPTYVVSKVFLSALTWIQHRQFLTDKRKDMVINAVHPGFVDTDLTAHRGVLTTAEGAAAAVTCCLIPPDGQPRGQMVWFDTAVVDWVNDDIAGTTPVLPIKH